MRIVVDTNIVFSAILNSSGSIGDLLFNSDDQFDLYSSELLISELTKYKDKLQKHTKMSPDQVEATTFWIIKSLTIIDLNAIPESNWQEAFQLTKDVDEKDTPFIATTMAINGFLWTGDKRLVKGLKDKGFEKVISTQDLILMRNDSTRF